MAASCHLGRTVSTHSQNSWRDDPLKPYWTAASPTYPASQLGPRPSRAPPGRYAQRMPKSYHYAQNQYYLPLVYTHVATIYKIRRQSLGFVCSFPRRPRWVRSLGGTSVCSQREMPMLLIRVPQPWFALALSFRGATACSYSHTHTSAIVFWSLSCLLLLTERGYTTGGQRELFASTHRQGLRSCILGLVRDCLSSSRCWTASCFEHTLR